jgi:c-di-AMP phosphodiesterase-like protein
MENNKKQTAVEWFKDVIESFGNKHELQMSWDTFDEVIEQAKEMEREQMINIFKAGHLYSGCPFGLEQYYNETFKSE